MSDIAIRVEELSKLYRIGLKEQMHDTLGGALLCFLRQPAVNFKRLRELTKFHPDGRNGEDTIWALKDVSFEVRRGEVIGIIGRNGAGKSTLLKIISRITEPTSGRVTIDGRVSSLLEVGTGFHPELTGRENVYLNGAILGMTKKEIARKFDEIIEFAEVEKFVDTPVKRYSSGMMVRLAFAVAAHLEPEILVVDEVLAVGDSQFQKKCLGKMEEVTGLGRTVVLVSHQMQVIQSIGQRAILLDEGRIVRSGNPAQVIAMYLGQSRNRYDLTRFQQTGSQEAWFEELVVCGEDSSTPETISQDETLSLRFKVTTNNSLRNVNLAIAVSNAEGIVLFSHSWSDDHPFLNLDQGCFTFRVSVPTKYLRPGSYWLTLCLTKNYADCVTLVSDIQLPPITLPSESDKLIESRRWGIMQLPCHWEKG